MMIIVSIYLNIIDLVIVGEILSINLYVFGLLNIEIGILIGIVIFLAVI
jgi:hypothetical protein